MDIIFHKEYRKMCNYDKKKLPISRTLREINLLKEKDIIIGFPNNISIEIFFIYFYSCCDDSETLVSIL